MLVSNGFLSQIKLKGFMGITRSDCIGKLKIAAGCSQSLVNLGLPRPDTQIQFRTFIKKAVFTELPTWPIAHRGDTGHWAPGQFDQVTSASFSKGCDEMLAWLLLLRPQTVGHEQSWDFSAEYLCPRLTNIRFCPQENQSHWTYPEMPYFGQNFPPSVLFHQQTSKW